MSLVSKFGDLDVYLGADHSQLEIRVLAQMSKDKRLIELIQSGEDIHASVGHELTGQPIAKIMKDRPLRTAIKGLHFGIIYGLTEESLYYHLLNEALERGEPFNMSKEDVAKLWKAYFKRFSGVAEFIEHQHQFAQDNAYVETLFGFVREIAIAGDETRTTFWANQAVNSPIQGTAHQLMLIAMAIIGIKPQTYNLLQRPSMEVHDSLYVFVKLLKLVEAYKQFNQLMEKEILVYVAKWWPEVKWVVPLKSEAKAGFRLGVMVEYAGEPPEEFVEKWCQKNQQFQIKLQKEMKKEVV
jgi:DNA polymerase-1